MRGGLRGLNPSSPPDRLLAPAEIVELSGPERRLAGGKELVELRRRDARCREHGMGLAAMVDIMLEEMHQEAIAPLRLHAGVAIDPHGAGKTIRRQCLANRNQAPIDRSLSGPQLGERGTWNGILPGPWPEPAAFESVDVEQIDDVDVVQRRL